MKMLLNTSCYLAVDLDVIKTALLNTVLGMGIVFCVLVLIAFIISLLGFLPKLFGNKKKEVKVVKTQVAVTKEPTVVEPEEEELVDDTELVAVITAAIMASMGDEAPADGLVVRSIRRTNRKKFA